ncbi:hypothetical protein [Thomasclavelia cocleata]|mgnify:FL=1|jgi:hypothetical protein|uniref:Uncharacterized protein n=1 Tax=Thomasclavelia cocleata TaxID=69824 RepID=A0A1I0DHH3_9FIRM|nr:hypothetical protein [Thomasclavelia cocleata]MCI9131093.1 hypothetical protein [Thomasclavelia cocleata]MCI9630098.1 hypothetical protein [Thomasclavelia cocleata]MCR1961131.1 hypothetical protein [Thomasclavelia cocleata]NDO42653.1 hypothetical protein [Thomasclavelia cocleata]PJN80442.1 hypothetical protein CWE04_08395 [Thomasclavelia cocleata]
MSNSSYDDLFSLDFIEFKKLVYEQGVDIDEKQLLIIYELIQNNQYALVDSHYNEVLYNYISEKTSISTCLKIKSFLINFPNYFKFGLKI